MAHVDDPLAELRAQGLKALRAHHTAEIEAQRYALMMREECSRRCLPVGQQPDVFGDGKVKAAQACAPPRVPDGG